MLVIYYNIGISFRKPNYTFNHIIYEQQPTAVELYIFSIYISL